MVIEFNLLSNVIMTNIDRNDVSIMDKSTQHRLVSIYTMLP